MKRTLSVKGDETFMMNEKNSKCRSKRRLSEEEEKHEETSAKKTKRGTRRKRSEE
jgi:hypothetical protein